MENKMTMWTIMWKDPTECFNAENCKGTGWDRFVKREEVIAFANELIDSGISKGDIIIFPPAADEFLITYDNPII